MKSSRALPAILPFACLWLAGSLLHTYQVQATPAHRTPARPAPDLDDPASWRRATPAERQAAIAVIVAQLRAFQKDDYRRAALYQSRGMRRVHPSPMEFRTMMRRAYPEFTDYKAIQAGNAITSPQAGLLEVPVVLTGRDGVTVRAVYLMIREARAYRVQSVFGGMRTPLPDGIQMQES